MKDTPAFPTGIITDGKGKIIGGSNGMTLRDYFAANAMRIAIQSDHDGIIHSDIGMVAKFAYKMADAMMKAREL